MRSKSAELGNSAVDLATRNNSISPQPYFTRSGSVYALAPLSDLELRRYANTVDFRPLVTYRGKRLATMYIDAAYSFPPTLSLVGRGQAHTKDDDRPCSPRH